MLTLRITLGKNRIFLSAMQKCPVAQKYAKNAFSCGASPRTPLGELTTLPKPPSRLGRGHPS